LRIVWPCADGAKRNHRPMSRTRASERLKCTGCTALISGRVASDHGVLFCEAVRYPMLG
jgi:hypothetical protein